MRKLHLHTNIEVNCFRFMVPSYQWSMNKIGNSEPQQVIRPTH